MRPDAHDPRRRFSPSNRRAISRRRTHCERRLIFKNIGREDWTIDIDCYLRNGGYEQLKKAVTMSRAEIVNEVKSSGLARTRRRRIPLRREVGLHQAGRDEADLSHLQRGRVGARHVQGSLHHSPGSASADRGHADLLLSPSARRLAYIYIRGEFPEGAKILETRDRGSARARISSARTFSAPASTARSTSIAARAPTSAAKRPA